jgi:hypothetical protein
MNAASPTHGSTIGELKKTNLSTGIYEIGGITMCSLMLSMQAAPTSASLVQSAYCDICPPVHENYKTEANPLHMNWFMVEETRTDSRTQMRWVVGL